MPTPFCTPHGGSRGRWEPHAGVVVIIERVRGLLPCKVLPLALELCLGGPQVHLPGSQAVCILLKVGHAAMGTLL